MCAYKGQKVSDSHGAEEAVSHSVRVVGTELETSGCAAGTLIADYFSNRYIFTLPALGLEPRSYACQVSVLTSYARDCTLYSTASNSEVQFVYLVLAHASAVTSSNVKCHSQIQFKTNLTFS